MCSTLWASGMAVDTTCALAVIMPVESWVRHASYQQDELSPHVMHCLCPVDLIATGFANNIVVQRDDTGDYECELSVHQSRLLALYDGLLSAYHLTTDTDLAEALAQLVRHEGFPVIKGRMSQRNADGLMR